jgi:hypothetical protein
MILDKTELYQCPRETCPKRFIDLSGFVAHLESGVCGHTTLERVQQLFLELINPSQPIPNFRVAKQGQNGGYGSLPPTPPAPGRDGGDSAEYGDRFAWESDLL